MRYIRYYGLFLLYYIIALSILLFTFEPIGGTRDIGGIGVFLALSSIGSPFLLIKILINRYYPKSNKVKHAHGIAYTIIGFMLLHVIGANASHTLNQSSIPFYAFHLALIVALFSYKESKLLETKI